MAKASVWYLHQLQGVRERTVEVPEAVRADSPRKCSWNWVLMSDGGLPMGNARWVSQTEKLHEHLHSALKVQEEIGSRITSFLAIATKLLWVGQIWTCLPGGSGGTKAESPLKNTGGTSCPSRKLKHGKHDPSWFLMISFKHGHRPFLYRARLGQVICSMKRFTRHRGPWSNHRALSIYSSNIYWAPTLYCAKGKWLKSNWCTFFTGV